MTPEDAEKIQEDFLKLQGILDYSVGITEFESDDYREATELFIRFNGTGKRLSNGITLSPDEKIQTLTQGYLGRAK